MVITTPLYIIFCIFGLFLERKEEKAKDIYYKKET